MRIQDHRRRVVDADPTLDMATRAVTDVHRREEDRVAKHVMSEAGLVAIRAANARRGERNAAARAAAGAMPAAPLPDDASASLDDSANVVLIGAARAAEALASWRLTALPSVSSSLTIDAARDAPEPQPGHPWHEACVHRMRDRYLDLLAALVERQADYLSAGTLLDRVERLIADAEAHEPDGRR